MLTKPEFLSVIADYLIENTRYKWNDCEYVAGHILHDFMWFNGYRYGNADCDWGINGARQLAKDWMKSNK